MLKHFSKYSFQLLSMFAVGWVAAALAVGSWWYLRREDLEQAAKDRFMRYLPGNDR